MNSSKHDCRDIDFLFTPDELMDNTHESCTISETVSAQLKAIEEHKGKIKEARSPYEDQPKVIETKFSRPSAKMVSVKGPSFNSLKPDDLTKKFVQANMVYGPKNSLLAVRFKDTSLNRSGGKKNSPIPSKSLMPTQKSIEV